MLFATAAVALLAAGPAFGQAVRRTDDDGKPSASTFFPPNRGSNALVSKISPCQGYEQGSRVDYPLTGGVISWGAIRDIHNITIRYSTDGNPTSQDQFQDALTNVDITGYTGEVCMPGPNWSSLGLSAGDVITMQFSYTAGPQRTEQFECSDLTLVTPTEFEAGNWDTQCINRISSTQTKRVSASNPNLFSLQKAAAAEAEASARAAMGGSSLNVTEAGVIGAMVTLGAVLLTLFAAYFAGVVSFGKNKKQIKHTYHDSSDAKTVSSV